MKGLTRLEVDLLLDAASDVGEPRVAPSPTMTEACYLLRERGLISFVFDENGMCGVITPRGKIALCIALSEPSLVTP